MLLLALATTAPGQQAEPYEPVILRRWSTSDGLPQNSVRVLRQTRDGYLWVGTYGGLVRYDGLRFQTYGGPAFERLASARVTSLYEDTDGALWIGTSNRSLACLRNGGVTWHRQQVAPASGPIWGVARGPQGRLWYGSRLLSVFDGTTWSRHRVNDRDPDDDGVMTLAQRGDELWISGTDRLRYLDREGRLHVVPGSGYTWSLHRDEDDGLWIGGLERLGWIAPDSHEIHEIEPPPRPPKPDDESENNPRERRMEALLTDSSGGFWVGLDDGLYYARLPDRRPIPRRLAFRKIDLHEYEGPIRALLEDREGNIWVGSDTQGLIQLRRDPFLRYPLLEVPTRAANEVAAHGEEVVVLAANGFNERDGPGFSGKNDASVEKENAVAFDATGNRWTVRRDVLEKRSPDGDVTTIPLPSPCTGIHPDPRGHLWLISREALYRVEGGAVHSAASFAALPDSTSREILGRGPGGALWIAIGYRAFRLGPGGLEEISSPESWPSHEIRSLYVDERGICWLTTYGAGLVRYDPEGPLTVLTSSDGLADDALGGMLADEEGHLWINSNRGVFQVDIADLEARVRDPEHFIPSRLLLTGEGNGPSAARTKDGRMWFPTLDGVVAIDPRHQPAIPPAPHIIIESIRVAAQEASVATSIAIPAGPSDFEVRYTAPSFLAPHGLRFRHRLNGYDQTWSEPRADRVIRYTNLRPGSYDLEIQVRSSQGGSWKNGPSLQVDIAPDFWERPWFIALVAALLAALVGSGHLLRTRSIRTQNAALSDEISRREAVEQVLLQNEALLRASEERNRLLVENAPETILLIDAEGGGIIGANSRVERLLGIGPEALVNRSFSDFAYDDAARRDLEAALAGAPEAEASHLETRLRGAQDRELLCELRLIRTRWKDHDVVQGSITDVTERRRVEEQLQHKSKIEAIGSLAGSVAHEINNILTAMSGHVESMEPSADTVTPEAACKVAPDLRACIEHAASVTQQLLAFGKKQTTVARDFVADQELRSMEPVLRRLVRDDIRLIFDLDAAEARLEADPHQLQQILFNLLVNAVDALPDGGRVRIATRLEPRDAARWDEPRHLVIEIADSGPGIPEEIIGRIFDPFFSTKESHGSTGLGLSTVQRIVEQLGGTIAARNLNEGGACFTTRLPALLPETVEPPASANPRGDRRPKATILVCDDFEPLLQIVASPLEGRGYEVLRASTPEQALHLAQSHREPLDLLITDVVMPSMNGRELKTAIEKLHPGVSVLFMSGYDADIVARRGVVEADIHFIHKPFTMRDMAGRVASILEARTERSSAAEI